MRTWCLRVLPWVVIGLFLIGVSHAGGAGWRQIGAYGIYLAAFVTLPGVLCWRLLWSGGPETWLDQLVFGTLTGICVQLPVYLTGLVLGSPKLVATLPLLTLAVVLVRPDRRRILLPRLEPVPPSLAWAVAVVSMYSVGWVAGIGWLTWAHPGSAPANPNGDEPYQVALVAELKHHFPPVLPTVAGLSLDYHWFANAHLAAGSWLTGLEPALLLDRLWLLPTLFLIVAAVGLVAFRLTGSALCGVMAVGILGLVGNFSPFGSRLAISHFDELFLSFWDPLSPSLDFGTAQLMLAVWVLLHLFRVERTQVRDFVLLALCCAMLTGAKATLLPVFTAGLVGTVLAQRMFVGRVRRRQWIALAMSVAAFGLAHLVLYRGGSQGMWIEPFHLAKYVVGKLHLAGAGRPGVGTAAALLAVSWACGWAGVPMLLRRVTRVDPRAAFLVAGGSAGVLATLALGHPHYSEDYFARAATPLLAVAAAWGLWSVISRLSPSSRLVATGIGLGTGLTGSVAARAFGPDLPLPDGRVPSWSELLVPYLVASAVVGTMILVAFGRAERSMAVAMALVAVTSLGLVRVADTTTTIAGRPWRKIARPARATAVIGAGGLAAARWLREHSHPDDLVATNAHFRRPGSDDNRNFWIAGYAERRVLVEGWGYTPPVNAEAARRRVLSYQIGFWDPKLLATNDAAFVRPSRSTVGALKHRYGVRWLFVDTRFPGDVRALAATAWMRCRVGDYAILELRSTGASRSPGR